MLHAIMCEESTKGQRYDNFFVLSLENPWNKQSNRRWNEMLLRSYDLTIIWVEVVYLNKLSTTKCYPTEWYLLSCVVYIMECMLLKYLHDILSLQWCRIWKSCFKSPPCIITSWYWHISCIVDPSCCIQLLDSPPRRSVLGVELC